jgi:hypothetical protein
VRAIADAFLGHYKRAFRTGRVAERFVEVGVPYPDVLTHLARAITDVLGASPLPSFAPQLVAGGDDAGMWVEILPVDWVRMVAAVPQERVAEVLSVWAQLAQEGSEPDPETWESAELSQSLRNLIHVAAEADASGKALIGLSAI